VRRGACAEWRERLVLTRQNLDRADWTRGCRHRGNQFFIGLTGHRPSVEIATSMMETDFIDRSDVASMLFLRALVNLWPVAAREQSTPFPAAPRRLGPSFPETRAHFHAGRYNNAVALHAPRPHT
jgi:hypothetical protein